MKTKIRTIIAILALGTIGITSINAIADNRKAANAEFVNENEQALNIESWMTDPSIWTSNVYVDTPDTENALNIESWMTDESLWK